MFSFFIPPFFFEYTRGLAPGYVMPACMAGPLSGSGA